MAYSTKQLLTAISSAGFVNAMQNPRKNEEWDIEWVFPCPKKEGEPLCEIVIGNRHTEFQPYVAWHCFSGNSYAWGHYCNSLPDAFEEAMYKLMNEIGLPISRD